MFNLDLLYRARWGDLFSFFTSGDPPLVFRLMIINTMFLLVFIIRNARAKKRMSDVGVYLVQGFLVLCNLAVMFQGEFISIGRWLENQV